MAITQTGQPKGDFNPAHNPIVYYFNSTNANEPGFRYIAQVLTPSNQLLFEKTLFKEVGTGECVLNLNRELQNYVDTTLQARGEFSPQNASDFYVPYKIQMGEEYQARWDYSTFIFAGAINWPNFNNQQFNPNGLTRTALSTTSPANVPPYQPGDWIFVTQSVSNPPRPQISGFHKVIDVFNLSGASGFYHTIVLELPWVGSGPTTPGTTRFADGRKQRDLNLLEITNQTAFGGALTKKEFLDWDEDDYRMNTGTTGSWLTDIPNPYKIRRDSLVLLNSYKDLDDTNSEGPARWWIETSDGNAARINSFNLTNVVRQFDVSPTRSSWGSTISGSTPIITSATTHYDVYTTNNTDVIASEKQRFIIDDSCQPKWEVIEMIFKDRLGSIIPFQFELRNVESRILNSSKFRKHLGGKDSNNTYGYELTDGGEIVYDSHIEREYLLRTDYLTDEYAEFFVKLIESPWKAIKIDGEYTRCNITSNSLNYEVKKEKWYELKRYEIRVKLSNNESINA